MAHAGLLLSLFLLLSPSRAQAQDDANVVAEVQADAEPSPEEWQAQERFRAGQELFVEGNYAEAIAEFEAAFELSPQPLLLYNIYLAYERLGEIDQAIDYLDRYLPDAGEGDRVTLERRLANLRARAAERSTDPEPSEPEPTPIVPAPSSGGGVPVGSIVGFSVGGAGLLTFGVFALLATLEDSDLAETCGADAGATCGDDDVSTLSTFSLIADIGIGVAAAGAITGLVFLLLDGGSEEPPPVTASPWLGPDRAGVGVRGSF